LSAKSGTTQNAAPDQAAAAAAAESTPLPGAREGRDPARAIKRGPSRVPPEFVAATQRDRLYDGLVHTVAKHGYVDATVTDICRAAGVTRPAFYVHFDGKQDAFLATYRHGTGVLFRMMEKAYSEGADWRDGARAGLRVLLDVLASVPAFAQMAIVEIEAVGPPARREREDLLRRFAQFFTEAPRPDGPARPDVLIATLVGGVYSAIYRHVAAGKAAELPQLLPTLEYFLFVPFLGAAEAAREVDAEDADDTRQRAVAPCAESPRADNPADKRAVKQADKRAKKPRAAEQPRAQNAPGEEAHGGNALADTVRSETGRARGRRVSTRSAS
jgi:AcrR family transcriptional regulator